MPSRPLVDGIAAGYGHWKVDANPRFQLFSATKRKVLPNMSSRGLGEMQGSRRTSRGYFTFVEWQNGIVNEQMMLNGSIIYDTLFASMGTIAA
eukprot:scaffold145688_cov33-Cyclotella_meneghiniana.AAC.1